MTLSIKKVVLVSAGGSLGKPVLQTLLDSEKFDITVLSRKSSKSTFPAGVRVATVSDDYPVGETLELFRGQDAVVSLVSPMALAGQRLLIDAASQAGVKLFMPGEYGSDTADKTAVELISLFQVKAQILEYLAAVEKSSGMAWTGIVNGAFFDWGLETGFLGFDLKARKARILDGGDKKFSSSTLATVARAVQGVLEHPEDRCKNRLVYVQSFCVSQNEILAALEKATGGSKWEVEKVESAPFMGKAKEKADAGDVGAIYDLVWANGVTNGDVSGKGDFVNDLFGLGDDLETETKKVLKL